MDSVTQGGSLDSSADLGGTGLGQQTHRRALLRKLAVAGASAASLSFCSACGILPLQTHRSVRRLGFLALAPRDARADVVTGFVGGLADLGYREGDTITIDWRFGNASELPQLATDLVASAVDVMVALASPASLAASHATSSIPIVAVNISAPVEQGLVVSLAHPGANLTGTAQTVPGSVSKYIDLLREIVPDLKRIAVFVDASNPSSVAIWPYAAAASEQVGVDSYRIDVRSDSLDVEAAFQTAMSSSPNALLDDATTALLPVRDRVAELALQYRMPAIGDLREFATAGLLMSYGPDPVALSRYAARYVDKILKGAKPSDLPMEQPTIWYLAVNKSTLQTLGLTIPPSVLPLVTDWIA